MEILTAINPTINNRVTDILELPIPEALDARGGEVRSLAERAVNATRELDALSETTPDIADPIVLVGYGTVVADIVSSSITAATRAASEIVAAELALDDIFPPSGSFSPRRGWPGALPDRTSRVVDLVSFAVGCMFGRYSLDARGLVLAESGATMRDYLERIPSPTFTPDVDNVIPFVDDGWFEDDIVDRFRQFLRSAFGPEHVEENLRFVEEALGVKTLRDYFITKAGKSKFYDDHVKRYKKRPIYWMFSSPKGSFNALVYMHRYSPSTVSSVLNEYLREYRVKLEVALVNAERAGVAGSSKDQKEADRLRKVLAELSDYEHDVLYPLAARQIAIDLDDGVKANYPKFYPALKKIAGLEAAE